QNYVHRYENHGGCTANRVVKFHSCKTFLIPNIGENGRARTLGANCTIHFETWLCGAGDRKFTEHDLTFASGSTIRVGQGGGSIGADTPTPEIRGNGGDPLKALLDRD